MYYTAPTTVFIIVWNSLINFSFFFVGKPVEPMVFEGRKKNVKGTSINIAAMAF